MTRNKLYVWLSIACFAGYFWLILLHYTGISGKNEPGICLIKTVSHIPCPSCGTSRSVLLMLKGDFPRALKMNPFGFFIAMILTISPLWIITDLLRQQSGLFHFYLKTECFLKRKMVAFSAILLVLVNWFWNIQKEL